MLAASLDEVVQRAGGVIARRDGRRVVAGFGSAAGELAACVSGVGVADCSHLTVLEPRGPGVDALVQRLTGVTPAGGGAVRCAGAWWCRPDAGRLVVVCDAGRGERLEQLIAGRAASGAEPACLAVVGRRAPPVLADLGVYGPARDPRRVAPVRVAPVAGVDALWLLARGDEQALAVVPRAAAAAVWREVLRAGRRHGICCVGVDAVQRFALIRG